MVEPKVFRREIAKLMYSPLSGNSFVLSKQVAILVVLCKKGVNPLVNFTSDGYFLVLGYREHYSERPYISFVFVGPMVWYQRFEYAVGHWLTKAAEHVLGSVLCAPGCFSLYRGSALMDNNVMQRYSTEATQATHFVQYDQGKITPALT